jgi:hypothetical protein
MDEIQATSFILNRLELGYDKVDIATDLSQSLGVSPELVMRFVRKVADSYTPVPPPVEPEPISRTPQVESESPISSQPPAVIDEPLQNEPGYSKFTYQETQQENPQENSQLTSESSSHQTQIGEPSSSIAIDMDDLTTFVLQSVKKRRRHSDIVGDVCKRTLWHWEKAQLFVARTQTEHHEELSRSQRKFMIPFSIAFILGGALLLIWSITTLIDYYIAYTGSGYSTLPADVIPLVIGGLLSSIGIVAGGIFGIYKMVSRL